MLQTDVIHKLDLIAFEGWEYHKLPLENLENYESTSVGGNLDPQIAIFPGRNKQLEAIPIPGNEGYDLLSSAE